MSLLMDALRKAEEAKKKAAQEGQSEEPVQTPVANERQIDAAPEKAQVDTSPEAPTPELELRMADMEELPPRAPVQTIKTDIEFDDEEDYVLPSSVGAPVKTELDDQPDAVGSQEEAVPQAEAVSIEAPEEELDSIEEPSLASPEPIALDNLQEQEQEQEQDKWSQASAEEAGHEAPVKAPLETEVRPASRPLIVAKVAEKSRAMGGQTQGKDKNEPERRTARNVFAAKQSRLSPQNIRVAAGAALVLVVFVFSTYFYISLNQESTFNIPEGNYVASEFVDAGINSEIDDGLSADDLATSIAGADDIAATDITQLLASDATVSLERAAVAVSDEIDEILEELAVAAEPANPQVEPAAQPSPDASTSQPEAIAAPRDTVVTTQSDMPVEVPEPAVIEPTITQEPVRLSTASSAQLTPDAEPTTLISFRRQASVRVVDPNVSRAYTAYQQGSIDQAEVLYRQALARDPLQRDALVGLATIAARKGNSSEALDLYSKLLARNPSDPIARAGLMELLPSGSPAQQEAELRRLLNEHPNVAPISYAYGNFLASAQRWSEAQQAYFKALQLAKADAVAGGLVNPDYAFNLAVSLEHLNQREPAENYYREALQFAANHPAGFDLAAVRARLEGIAGSVSND